MKVIIGLGNPGSKYEKTRHNIGFEVVNALSQITEFNIEKFKEQTRLHAQIALGTNADKEQILLVRPQTYMNNSGQAFIAIKNWYKLDLNDFLIVHDDVSLPLGKIRFQKAGGAGGQHGVESIINCAGGNKAINRLKIGVGPDPGGDKRAEYVLQKFSTKEKTVMDEVVAIAVKGCLSWVCGSIDSVMNEFNCIAVNREDKSELQSRS